MSKKQDKIEAHLKSLAAEEKIGKNTTHDEKVDKAIAEREEIIAGNEKVYPEEEVGFDEALTEGRKAIEEAVLEKTPTELYEEVRQGLVERRESDPVDEVHITDDLSNPVEVEADNVRKFKKDLTDERAHNVATRNVDNVSAGKGVNRPIFGGPAGRRLTRTKDAPSKPMKSIPGKRSGVFEINPAKTSNDVTRSTVKTSKGKPTSSST